MQQRKSRRKLTSFQVIIAGFMGVILLGSLFLALPVSSCDGIPVPYGDALFTAVSAVCVTGLVVRDTATAWSVFGQAVILVLIQVGALGIVSAAVMFSSLSGRKIDLAHRSTLRDSLSAPQIGGVVRMTRLIFRITLITEAAGAAALMPVFCRDRGAAGIFPAVFHAVSAFCNAGFDLMGSQTGPFSSLTGYAGEIGVVIPICLLIILGGIGFLTWEDALAHGVHLKRYRMQSKVILVSAGGLILVPAVIFFFSEYAAFPLGKRVCLSVFQAVTPRTAGFNTADLTALSGPGRLIVTVLMLIGGAPGSTAGGIKTTTAAVLVSNALAVFRRKKSAVVFSRRVEDGTVKHASALLWLYLFFTLTGAGIISGAEGLPLEVCVFEAFSAVGTVGLSMGITPALGALSRGILIFLMFFGRVGGMTVMLAALGNSPAEVSQHPAEKIAVG